MQAYLFNNTSFILTVDLLLSVFIDSLCSTLFINVIGFSADTKMEQINPRTENR